MFRQIRIIVAVQQSSNITISTTIHISKLSTKTWHMNSGKVERSQCHDTVRNNLYCNFRQIPNHFILSGIFFCKPWPFYWELSRSICGYRESRDVRSLACICTQLGTGPNERRARRADGRQIFVKLNKKNWENVVFLTLFVLSLCHHWCMSLLNINLNVGMRSSYALMWTNS